MMEQAWRARAAMGGLFTQSQGIKDIICADLLRLALWQAHNKITQNQ